MSCQTGTCHQPTCNTCNQSGISPNFFTQFLASQHNTYLQHFHESLCCDPHKIGYLVIAVLALAHATIAFALGVIVSAFSLAVLGTWWASIPIMLGGIVGIAAALTGNLVECSGNIWVLTTAILAGAGAVIGIVAITYLGLLYSIYSSWPVGIVLASEIFLIAATGLSLALHIYSVFLLGLGCQIPCNDTCEPKCDPCGNGVQMSGSTHQLTLEQP